MIPSRALTAAREQLEGVPVLAWMLRRGGDAGLSAEALGPLAQPGEPVRVHCGANHTTNQDTDLSVPWRRGCAQLSLSLSALRSSGHRCGRGLGAAKVWLQIGPLQASHERKVFVEIEVQDLPHL